MRQRCFIVVGAKGGVGATTTAIKLIQQLPAATERMIVDADLAGKRSLAIWYDVNDDLDVGRTVESPATVKVPMGPLVMELARTYEDGFMQTAASVRRSIERLPETALVVVDAPQPFAATVRPFVALASKIVIMSEPTRLGVGAANAMLAAMDRFGINGSRLALVLTDARRSATLPQAQIERSLRVPVHAHLPHDADPAFADAFATLVQLLAAAPPFEPADVSQATRAGWTVERRHDLAAQP